MSKSNCCEKLIQNLGFKVDTSDKGVSIHFHPSEPKKASALKNVIDGLKELCPCDSDSCC